MREILLRGKRIDNGEWVEGALFQCDDGTMYIATSMLSPPEDGGPAMVACHMVYDNTVGQYTGLTDKNSKKIFEGDILLFLGCHYKVLFFAEHARFAPTRDAFLVKRYGFQPFCAFDMRCAKVIGNIHDNPELLKVGE